MPKDGCLKIRRSRSNSWPGLRLSLTPGTYWELGPSVTGAYKPSEQSSSILILDGASSMEPCPLSAEEGASKKKTREYTRNSGGRAPYIVFFGPGYVKMESSQSEASDVMITASLLYEYVPGYLDNGISL